MIRYPRCNTINNRKHFNLEAHEPRRDAVLVRSQPCDTRQHKNLTVSHNESPTQRPTKDTDKIQSGPEKCIHSLLINIFGINLNEISISG
jgi:hypothetical protein